VGGAGRDRLAPAPALPGAPAEAALLAEVEAWRADLAARLARREPALPAAQLDDRVLGAITARLLARVRAAGPRPAPEALGRVYERLLDRAVVVGPGRRVRLEPRPERRQRGGVYYTPPAVVADVVARTLGPLLAGRSGRAAAGLCVVDLACGGGAFLVGALRHLLAWHRDRAVAELPRTRGRLVRDAGGAWRLTRAARLRVLRAHVYGVDLDPRAVAVSRLALLLAALDGDPAPRALPDLAANLVCGNALLGPDFAAAPATRRAARPLDLRAAFPAAFRRGGFDAAIGNPPYLDAELMSARLPGWRAYCAGRYAAATGNWDAFCVFAERAVEVLREGGRAGLVVPNKLLAADYAAGARHVLAGRNTLLAVRDYAAVKLFAAAVYPVVVVARRGAPGRRPRPVRCERMAPAPGGGTLVAEAREVAYAACCGDARRPWRLFGDASERGLCARMRALGTPLDRVATVLGAATVSEAYAIRPLVGEDDGAPGGLRLVNSGTIDRYVSLWGERPCRYLGASFARPVVARARQAALPPARLQQALRPKLVVAGLTRVLECFGDERGGWLAGKSTSVVLPAVDLRYLLGLLNSRLLTFYVLAELGGNRLQGGYLRLGPPQLRTLPIIAPGDATLRAEIIALVTRRHAQPALDRQIDDAVYRLYGVSPAERAAVEAAYAAAVRPPPAPHWRGASGAVGL
jgi:hypothetical protein